ncbi:MAG TPA: vanadium-dependent haloperoxidase, partial [Caldilineaceae bacterium]|nr:vanadium-dependent haloperoxidase [Caldilineaceae bacterium]
AEAYAKLGIALADAFITCWHTKYVYNVLRPLTYIQQVIDPTWNTPEITDPVTTPPFPEYTSGHSVQSAAAAAVLTELFGQDYAFVDHTHDALGYAPRTFGSFAEAANEAAISRLYGGIHYRSAIEQGLLQGRCIGGKVNRLQFREAGASTVSALLE